MTPYATATDKFRPEFADHLGIDRIPPPCVDLIANMRTGAEIRVMQTPTEQKRLPAERRRVWRQLIESMSRFARVLIGHRARAREPAVCGDGIRVDLVSNGIAVLRSVV